MGDFLRKNRTVILIAFVINAVFFVAVVSVLWAVAGPGVDSYAERDTGETDTYEPRGYEESRVIQTAEEANPAVVSITARVESPELTDREREFLRFFSPFLDIPQNQGGSRQVGGGSGFFVSSDGMIVTNRHVVDNENVEYTVVTENGEEYDATVIAKDPAYDVAILDIDISDAPHLSFGNSDGLRLGQTVVAIGNALAQFSHSISEGVVSGLSRSVRATDNTGRSELLQGVIQTDAAINPGNSGGPLLDLNGDVIGVNVAVAVDSENIGFALPANVVQNIVASVKETGEIVRPYVGVWYREITPALARAEDLPVEQGIVVMGSQGNQSGIVEGSPAEDAGIEEGDIILEVDGEEIGQDNAFSSEIRVRDVSETIELTILRNGEEQHIDVTLERAPKSLQ